MKYTRGAMSTLKDVAHKHNFFGHEVKIYLSHDFTFFWPIYAHRKSPLFSYTSNQEGGIVGILVCTYLKKYFRNFLAYKILQTLFWHEL